MNHHAQTGAIAIAIGALAASLPDPRQPTIILLLAGLGVLAGTAVGRIRRLSREKTRQIAENWSLAGGMIGAVLYLAAVLTTLGAAFDWTHTTSAMVSTGVLTVTVTAGVLALWRR